MVQNNPKTAQINRKSTKMGVGGRAGGNPIFRVFDQFLTMLGLFLPIFDCFLYFLVMVYFGYLIDCLGGRALVGQDHHGVRPSALKPVPRGSKGQLEEADLATARSSGRRSHGWRTVANGLDEPVHPKISKLDFWPISGARGGFHWIRLEISLRSLKFSWIFVGKIDFSQFRAGNYYVVVVPVSRATGTTTW